MSKPVTRVKVYCEFCRKEFSVKASILKRGRGRFCSLACRYAADKYLVSQRYIRNRGRNYELRHIAYQHFEDALKDRKITRLSSCQRCGSNSNIEGHHADYAKPLEVIWLCQSCHTKEHNKL